MTDLTTNAGTQVHVDSWREVDAWWRAHNALPTAAKLACVSGASEVEAALAIDLYAHCEQLPWSEVREAVLAAREVYITDTMRCGPLQLVVLDER